MSARAEDAPASLALPGSGWLGAQLTASDYETDPPPALRAALDALVHDLSDGALAAFGARCQDSAISGWVRSVEAQLDQGIGLVVIRRLATYPGEWQASRAATGLGMLFGQSLPQTRLGNLIGRVEDDGRALADPSARGHKTRDELQFHCDRADRILLLCVRPAMLGGESHVACSRRLFADLAETMPHSAEILQRPIPQDHRDSGDESRPWQAMPVFSCQSGPFVCRYVRRFITDAARYPDVALGDDVLAALDDVDALLAEEARVLSFRLNAGDVQIVNNNITLHARSSFQDDPGHRRLLFRVWLSHATSVPLPETFRTLYGDVAAGSFRGGVWPADTPRPYPQSGVRVALPLPGDASGKAHV